MVDPFVRTCVFTDHFNLIFILVTKQMVLFFTARKRSLGKVMFSQTCVKNSVHRGGSAPGGCLLWGGVSAPRGVPGGDPPGTATAAGGTHPTRMHSCLDTLFLCLIFPKYNLSICIAQF